MRLGRGGGSVRDGAPGCSRSPTTSWRDTGLSVADLQMHYDAVAARIGVRRQSRRPGAVPPAQPVHDARGRARLERRGGPGHATRGNGQALNARGLPSRTERASPSARARIVAAAPTTTSTSTTGPTRTGACIARNGRSRELLAAFRGFTHGDRRFVRLVARRMGRRRRGVRPARRRPATTERSRGRALVLAAGYVLDRADRAPRPSTATTPTSSVRLQRVCVRADREPGHARAARLVIGARAWRSSPRWYSSSSRGAV